jgi:hypothetical protein
VNVGLRPRDVGQLERPDGGVGRLSHEICHRVLNYRT